MMNAKAMTIMGTMGLCLGVVSVCAGATVTTGGTKVGHLVKLRQTHTVHQHKFDPGATDLHFKAWQKYDNAEVNGWEISISHFTKSSSKRGDQPGAAHTTLLNHLDSPPTTDPDNGMHAVDVVAEFTSPSDIVPWCTSVDIDVDFYITGYCNEIHISDTNWTLGDDEQTGAGDFGWDIGFPFPIGELPDEYLHTLTISNDGDEGTLWLTGLKILASPEDYNDLRDVPFTDEIEISPEDGQLPPGGSYVMDIQTTKTFEGNFIYITFKIGQSENDPDAVIVTAQHPVVVPPPIPTVSQWGMILMAALLLTAGAIVIVRRRRQVTA